MECCKLLLSVEQMPACSKFPRSGALRVHILAAHERPAVLRKKSELINPQPTFIFLSISQPLQLLVSLCAWIKHWEPARAKGLCLARCPGLSSQRQLCLEGRGQCSTSRRVLGTTGQCFPALSLPAASPHGLGRVCEIHIAIIAGCYFPRFGAAGASIILQDLFGADELLIKGELLVLLLSGNPD